MLCYGRLDFSKGINVDKTSASTEGTICHYWYFLHKGLKFQLDVCMCFECHDVSRMFINLEDIAILKTYGDNH